MIEETVDIIDRYKLAIGPLRGRYETMPGDGPLSLITAVLTEQWQITNNMSVDARTTVVKSKVSKLGSMFAMQHIGLLQFVIPGISFRRDSTVSMPPGSAFTILVRMVSGIVVADLKARKRVMCCDNAHSLDVQSWASMSSIFRGLEKNFLLVLGQRRVIKDEGAQKVSQWFIRKFPTQQEITLTARGMKLTRLFSHAPVAALLPARVGQEEPKICSSASRNSQRPTPRRLWQPSFR